MRRKSIDDSYSVRLRLPVHQGQQIRAMALQESRSDSAMISLLVAEALSARRVTTASTAKLVALLKGETSEPAHD